MAAGVNNENRNTTPRGEKSLTPFKHRQKISYRRIIIERHYRQHKKNYTRTGMLCNNKLPPLNPGPYLPILLEGASNWSDLPTK